MGGVLMFGGLLAAVYAGFSAWSPLWVLGIAFVWWLGYFLHNKDRPDFSEAKGTTGALIGSAIFYGIGYGIQAVI